MEQVLTFLPQSSEAVDASRLVRLLQRVLSPDDSAFLVLNHIPAVELQNWRNSRKVVYFGTLSELKSVVDVKIKDYSLAHFSTGTQWSHVKNTIQMRIFAAFYLAELRLVGHAYFLGFSSVIPRANRILENLVGCVRPLELESS